MILFFQVTSPVVAELPSAGPCRAARALLALCDPGLPRVGTADEPANPRAGPKPVPTRPRSQQQPRIKAA
jgi:hypothetical protein